MNGGLLVLPLLAVALSRLFRQPDERRACVVFGLAAMIFLWPALTTPSGVPNPVGQIQDLDPWRAVAEQPLPDHHHGTLDPALILQPWKLLVREQLRQGELPTWNPYSFLGQPFWANGQSGAFYPLNLLLAALPIRWGFLIVPWLRLLIAALGTRRLARSLGVGEVGARFAGLAFALGGMSTGFLLFTIGDCLSLVPWVLWAVEGLAAGTVTWRSLAVVGTLLAHAGHPGMTVHTAFVSAIYLGVRLACARGRGLRRTGSAWAIGWLMAGALAATQIIPQAMHLPDTPRWRGGATELSAVNGEGTLETESDRRGPPWSTVLPMTLRWVLPWSHGDAAEGTWFGPFFDLSSRVFVGLSTLVLALWGLAVLRRRGELDPRWTAVLAMSVFAALVAYRTPGLLRLMELLPVVGVGQLHRLLFVPTLGLALLAGLGADPGRPPEKESAPSPQRRCTSGPPVAWVLVSTAILVVASGVAAVLLWQRWLQQELVPEQLAWMAWAVAASAVLWLVLRTMRGRVRDTTLLALLIAELTVAHAAILPGFDAADGVESLYPTTGAIAFLQQQTARDGSAIAGVGSTLRPDLSIVYGLRDVRGDDPARPRRFDDFYHRLGRVFPPVFRPIERWDTGVLDRAGVRWVIAPPADGADAAQPRESSWRLAYDGQDGRVFERPRALPPARWRDRPEQAVPLEWRGANERVLRLDRESDARGGLLVVAEAWAPGWRARVQAADGTWDEAPVVEDDYLMRIDVPAGSRAVRLGYRPPGLVAGATITLIALLVFAWDALRRRPS